jgi:hypothetical protein
MTLFSSCWILSHRSSSVMALYEFSSPGVRGDLKVDESFHFWGMKREVVFQHPVLRAMSPPPVGASLWNGS